METKDKMNVSSQNVTGVFSPAIPIFSIRFREVNVEKGSEGPLSQTKRANSQTGYPTNFGSMWLFLGFGIPRSSHHP